ncbi:MAG: alcohol dehydrogenase [Bacteroidia bacterium]|nr:MAG: alcohol dehydrogenase [Bacteroidia bacterium]
MNSFMKAAVLEGVHQPIQIKDVPIPDLSAHQALVKLKACALNHRDWWIQKGLYAGLKFPIILGSDGAGVVVKVANPEHEHWLNQEVMINPSLGWGDNERVQSSDYRILGLPEDGTFAEYVAVPVKNIVKKPSYLSWEEAAALPLAGLTAYRALFTRGEAKPNENILITGVGGGVALFAFQMAVAIGANVWVTSGKSEKIQKAIQLGAKGGANYKEENWAKSLKKDSHGGLDLIIDSAAGKDFKELIEIAKPGGRIVFYGGTNGNIPELLPAKIFWKQLDIKGSTMGSDKEFLQLVQFFEQHQIKPIVSEVFSLLDAETAIRRLDEPNQFGKIVMRNEI